MRPETKQALEEAMARGDLEEIAVITQYLADDWDPFWPWPGPEWLKGRYESWASYRDRNIRLAQVYLEYR